MPFLLLKKGDKNKKNEQGSPGRKDEILSAIVKSGRSYEEIKNFLNVEETEGKTEE